MHQRPPSVYPAPRSRVVNIVFMQRTPSFPPVSFRDQVFGRHHHLATATIRCLPQILKVNCTHAKHINLHTRRSLYSIWPDAVSADVHLAYLLVACRWNESNDKESISISIDGAEDRDFTGGRQAELTGGYMDRRRHQEPQRQT